MKDVPVKWCVSQLIGDGRVYLPSAVERLSVDVEIEPSASSRVSGAADTGGESSEQLKDS